MAKKQVKVPIVQGRLGAKTVSLSNGAKKKNAKYQKLLKKISFIRAYIYLILFSSHLRSGTAETQIN